MKLVAVHAWCMFCEGGIVRVKAHAQAFDVVCTLCGFIKKNTVPTPVPSSWPVPNQLGTGRTHGYGRTHP